MRLGVMLTAGPESASVRTVRRLVETALDRGWEVALFFMHGGTRSAHAFSDLAARPGGPELAFCAHSAEQLEAGEVAGIRSGSQADWARIVDWAERVLVFG